MALTQRANIGCLLMYYLWNYSILITLPQNLIEYLSKKGQGEGRHKQNKLRSQEGIFNTVFVSQSHFICAPF